MEIILLVALFVVAVLILIFQIMAFNRKNGLVQEDLAPHFGTITDHQHRLDQTFRTESATGRQELAASLQVSLKQMSETIQASFQLQNSQLDRFSRELNALSTSNQERLEALRTTVEAKLTLLQADNNTKLDQMRATVEEKLQGTLEKRLGESFKQVSDRLEQVHKGLGEMQKLATDVGGLQRVLTNVKTRGGWGEIQLGSLLEQMLAPQQYERNAKTNPTREGRVEFAIKLPGQVDGGDTVWLPIDSKFPIEDYQRLLEAQELMDPIAMEDAGKQLTIRIKNSAKDISEKYLYPPATTDFGIMFLPTEGLYAEVARRPGLLEQIQRDYRVVVAGPSTFAALLNSLQMGFRTLTIQQRSSEVWKLLGAVKSEFGKFGDTLEGVQKKLQQATDTMDTAAKRSRAIERKLKNVEELPTAEAAQFLPAIEEEPSDDLL